MRKSFLKYLYGLLISGFLVAFVLIGVYISKEDSTLAFNIQTGAEEKQLYPFVNEKGEYYVFLPSYTDLNKVTIVTSDDSEIVLNGKDALDGMKCDVYEPNQAYDLVIDGQNTKITFMKSANVATLFLDTASGNMDYIHTDKNNEEYARMMLIDENGTVDCLDEMCVVKGRGNSTWMKDKKPYLLKLSKSTALLGMDKGLEWVLLSNSADESNLNNKIVYDLAKKINFDYSVDCKYTDVYLNGEYNGLYLLTTKVESAEERLDIDIQSDDFLARIDFESRLNNALITENGRFVEIVQPLVYDIAEKETMINIMEEMLLSGLFKKDDFSIDIESWVKKYLIDEITANIDADLCSNYFYYKDNVFYAGPVWDYDMVFGNCKRNINPKTFYANQCAKSANNSTLYYNALYKNKIFHKFITEIYEKEFLPILYYYINGEINIIAETIREATYLNSLRWRKMFNESYESNEIYILNAKKINDYLKDRIEFLNDIWLEGVKCFSLQFEMFPNDAYVNDSIVEGGCLKDSIFFQSGDVWVNLKTKEIVNPENPITEDMVLIKRQYDTENPTTVVKETDTRVFVVIMSGMLLIGFLIVAVVVDTVRRKKERRNICD